MTPKSPKERDKERQENNEKLGLVRIGPSYWVHKSRREDALRAIRKLMSNPIWRKKKRGSGDE